MVAVVEKVGGDHTARPHRLGAPTQLVRGLQEQHRQITARYDAWTAKIAMLPPGHRVWLQGKRCPLRLQ